MARRHDVRRGDGYIHERVTSTGDIRYQARWQEATSTRSKTFDTVEDAEDHLRNVGRLKRSGRYSPASRMTVAEAVAEFIERGRRRWTANTYASYRQVAESRLLPHIGSVPVVELTAHQVQRWIDDLATGYSASSIFNARIILRGTMQELVSFGVVSANPVIGTSAPSKRKSSKVVWNESQVRSVMAIVRDDVMLNAYYTLALTTGMRPGELRALQWADVQLDNGSITVQRTITRNENFRQQVGTTTKTSRIRTIAIPAITSEALQRLRLDQVERRLRTDGWHNTDLVFDRGNGLLLPQQTIARWHTSVCEKADVPRCRMHDLRHVAATQMLRAGVNIKIVSSILGHSSLATTADVYSHVDIDMQRSATDALASLLEDHA